MSEQVKRTERELVHKGSILEMYRDTMLLPNGHTAYWDFIKHKGAAAVVPVTEDGKIIMVRQYRNALERETLEIPAGAKNFVEEETRICAGRELEEETGFRCDNLEFLISIYTTVAFCNEMIDVYVARNLIPSKQHLDEDEFLNVVEMELEELLERIYAGTLQDAKTVAALLAYKNKYRA